MCAMKNEVTIVTWRKRLSCLTGNELRDWTFSGIDRCHVD